MPRLRLSRKCLIARQSEAKVLSYTEIYTSDLLLFVPIAVFSTAGWRYAELAAGRRVSSPRSQLLRNRRQPDVLLLYAAREAEIWPVRCCGATLVHVIRHSSEGIPDCIHSYSWYILNGTQFLTNWFIP